MIEEVGRKVRIRNRELSWLDFNGRVLQEAVDKRNPLYERIKFLAIYSSNLDEFFRVRVASIRSLLALKKTSQKQLNEDPEKLLRKAHRIIAVQQQALALARVERPKQSATELCRCHGH